LGGYILTRHENIPSKGDKILLDNFELTIEQIENARIESITLRILNKESD
jgi:CBS domain containing-hemolysin-like protein